MLGVRAGPLFPETREWWLARPSSGYDAFAFKVSSANYDACALLGSKFKCISKPRVGRTIVDILPAELFEMIFHVLFTTWPLATRTLRVSKTFAALATKTRNSLPYGEWWSGGRLPLQVVAAIPLPDLTVLRSSYAWASLGVHASSRKDIECNLLKVRRQTCPPLSTGR